MDCQYLPLSTTGQFPSLLLNYLAQYPSLTPFYGSFPTLEAFGEQIKKKQFSEESRQTLVQVLERQYGTIANKPDLAILAQPNTFVVTTGHQLNIFTGPLYILYKLVTTINLAKKLNEAYPDYRFVPVYWMATEDHDFAEINHFSLFGKTYTWETEQRGAVGRMELDGLESVLNELPETLPLFEKAYREQKTLADAVRYYINELLGSEGLVCLDPDDAQLKQLLVPVMKDELLNQATGAIVSETTHQLEALGYRSQISPRELNLFYLGDQLRERIVREGDQYRILNTDLHFSGDEMLAELTAHPEKFSPNVVLRPVYQETVLPNLAYIGGPSELPYWLQLKGIFDYFKLAFPLLVPRNFALYVNSASAKRMEKLGVSSEELFSDDVKLRRMYVERITENALHLAEEKQCFEQCFTDILNKALKVDKSLEGVVQGERAKMINALDNLEKRLKKAEERNHETVVNQLLALKGKLFPNGGLQERSENFLNFYLNDREFIQKLLVDFDPLDYRLMILTER